MMLALGWGGRRFHNKNSFSNPTEFGKSQTPYCRQKYGILHQYGREYSARLMFSSESKRVLYSRTEWFIRDWSVQAHDGLFLALTY